MSRKQHFHNFYPFNYLALACPGNSIGTISIHSTIWRWHVQEAAFALFLSIQLSGTGMSSRKQHLHNFYPINYPALACSRSRFPQFLSIQLSGAEMSGKQHLHYFYPFNYLAQACHPGSNICTISIQSTILRWLVQETAFPQFLSIQLSGAEMSGKQHLHYFYPFNYLALACHPGSSICTIFYPINYPALACPGSSISKISIHSTIWRWHVPEAAFAQFLSI